MRSFARHCRASYRTEAAWAWCACLPKPLDGQPRKPSYHHKRQTLDVGRSASCSSVVPINCASVNRLFRINLSYMIAQILHQNAGPCGEQANIIPPETIVGRPTGLVERNISDLPQCLIALESGRLFSQRSRRPDRSTSAAAHIHANLVEFLGIAAQNIAFAQKPDDTVRNAVADDDKRIG
ncbi:UNVERIFIED_ORG: hypothetical protein BCL66_1183 [Martelella mediterranea]